MPIKQNYKSLSIEKCFYFHQTEIAPFNLAVFFDTIGEIKNFYAYFENTTTKNKTGKATLFILQTPNIIEVIQNLKFLMMRFDSEEIQYPLIFDLTDLHYRDFGILYYFLLNNQLEIRIPYYICIWDVQNKKQPRQILLPSRHPDAAEKEFIHVISSGARTIQEIQDQYHPVKHKSKRISQPHRIKIHQ